MRSSGEDVEVLVTHPSTAGERSGLLLPLDRYLLWLCRRGWRPGPQCSTELNRPPMEPPIPAGTEPPIGPPLRPPTLPKARSRLTGCRGSESGVLPSVNGRSSSRRCHSCGQERSVGVGCGCGLHSIKTHQLLSPHQVLRAARTSAKCAAVSSMPLAPLSRRLRGNANRRTKNKINTLTTHSKH